MACQKVWKQDRNDIKVKVNKEVVADHNNMAFSSEGKPFSQLQHS